MAKHRRVDSIVGATSTGAGDDEKTRGHTKHGLWVQAQNLDPANDTLEVRGEVSPDGDVFAPVDSGAPAQDNVLSLTASDLYDTEDPDVMAGYIQHNDTPAEHIRANVTSFTDDAGSDLSVTAYVFIGGWTGRGKSFNERQDTPEHQLGR